MQISTMAHLDASKANRVLRSLVSMYRQHSEAKTEMSAEVAAESLADLHLYLSNYSPLNSAVLEPTGWFQPSNLQYLFTIRYVVIFLLSSSLY